MNKPIRIILADDHKVLRQGIAQVLDAQPDMQVVAQADNGLEAVQLAQQYQPDIALLDVNMPELDGVEAARRILAEQRQTGIIILTMYRNDEIVYEAIEAGVRGYLLKEAELDELLAAVRSVAKGNAVVDPAVASRVLAKLRQPGPIETTAEPALTERDVEILRLLAQGLSNQEIAGQLTIAEKTVRNRLSLIFNQLQLKNRTQAAMYAVRQGLIEPDATDSAVNS